MMFSARTRPADAESGGHLGGGGARLSGDGGDEGLVGGGDRSWRGGLFPGSGWGCRDKALPRTGRLLKAQGVGGQRDLPASGER
jgi:hypothetical protein